MKPTYDQLSQQLSDSQAALGKVSGLIEMLENLDPLEAPGDWNCESDQIAYIVRDYMIEKVKETLANPSLAKELRWREAVERGINSLKDFRERVLAEIPDEEFCQDEETHYSNLTEGVLPNLFDDMTKALKAIEEARHEGI